MLERSMLGVLSHPVELVELRSGEGQKLGEVGR